MPAGSAHYPRDVATSRMTEQVGRVLGGRYRLTAPIGSGASAEVYLAEDVTLHRQVAVKVLHPALADDKAFLNRFQAEARAAAALSHPHIMAVFDWGEADGPYLVLEFLGGGSLRAMLDQGRRLRPSQALLVGLDTARALDFAHGRGFVHRDIKPANLLFGDDGRLRIADFGLARALSEAAWTEPADSLLGTVKYAAPEQGSGRRVDGKADIYALGLVLIEAVTGSVPLVAESTIATLARRVETPVPVPDSLGPLKPVLERVGSPDPAERPDAAALGQALLRCGRQLDKPEPLPLAGAVVLPVGGHAQGDATLLPLAPPAGGDGDGGTGGDADATAVHRTADADGDADATAVQRVAGDDATLVRSGPPTAVFGGGSHAPDWGAEAVDPSEGTEPRRRRRRWPWFLLLVLLIGATAGGVFAYIQAQPATAVVPDVDGRPEVDARAVLQQAQDEAQLAWSIEVTRDFNEAVPEGHVISQDPPAGTVLEEEQTVRLLVSNGPPFKSVPDLAGITVEEAAARLVEAELAVGGEQRLHDEQVDEGLVLTWSSGGQERPPELRKGTPVDLVVSAGPAPRTVPNLAGKTVDQARAELRQVGLGAEVTERFSGSVEKGLVIGTDPGAGASVARGRTITVVVSKGPDLVKIPDIVGKALDEANRILEQAGLVPGDVTGPSKGKPFTTEPPPGAEVARNTEVDIFLKK
jgi:beta-lactam-binding protein with PASTA domain/tRNA A-37 threonylcarbamoyl transferase component Bud32